MKAIAIITIVLAAIWFIAAISSKGIQKRWVPILASILLMGEAILSLCLSWGVWTQILIIVAVLLLYYMLRKKE